MFHILLGKKCETNINDCTSASCKNGGTCLDEVNGFSCVCDNGYEGKYFVFKISNVYSILKFQPLIHFFSHVRNTQVNSSNQARISNLQLNKCCAIIFLNKKELTLLNHHDIIANI